MHSENTLNLDSSNEEYETLDSNTNTIQNNPTGISDRTVNDDLFQMLYNEYKYDESIKKNKTNLKTIPSKINMAISSSSSSVLPLLQSSELSLKPKKISTVFALPNGIDNSNMSILSSSSSVVPLSQSLASDVGKHVDGSVKQLITFEGTAYPQFNRALQAFVNRPHTYPDIFDVSRCLKQCNTKYNLHLTKDEIQNVAQDAFKKIRKSLLNRRQLDVYQTVDNLVLQTTLLENKRHRSILSDLSNITDNQQCNANNNNSNAELIEINTRAKQLNASKRST